MTVHHGSLDRQARNPVRLPDGNPASASAERAVGDDIIDHCRQVGIAPWWNLHAAITDILTEIPRNHDTRIPKEAV